MLPRELVWGKVPPSHTGVTQLSIGLSCMQCEAHLKIPGFIGALYTLLKFKFTYVCIFTLNTAYQQIAMQFFDILYILCRARTSQIQEVSKI